MKTGLLITSSRRDSDTTRVHTRDERNDEEDQRLHGCAHAVIANLVDPNRMHKTRFSHYPALGWPALTLSRGSNRRADTGGLRRLVLATGRELCGESGSTSLTHSR